ncbi:hypothetical protein FSARC_11351 [Fusarium sarcochroum]|uniref:Methyltransferase n=1 Tax=Fusarium sarcochroum TaxID=1208366 RepID=A0A8H4TFZ6_9HYPO|nr:hypothetical protein FSARC_11351 [Fusarium sarcochroum]
MSSPSSQTLREDPGSDATGSKDSPSDNEFSFDGYLDHTSNIEIDSGPGTTITLATMGCWWDMLSRVIKPAFERLKPGGWLENQELMGLLECDDDTMTDDNAFKVWCDELVDASQMADRPITFAASLKQCLIEAAFVGVTEKVYNIPINGRPKDPRLKKFGELWHANVADGLQAFSYGMFGRVKGWSREQIEVNLVDVRKGLSDQSMHGNEKVYVVTVVYGRKPENA